MIVWAVSVLLLIVIPTVVVIPYMLSKGVNLQNAEAMQNFLFSDYGAILLQVGLVIPVHALTFALSWAVVTKLRKYPFRESLGWQWGGFKIWHIIVIIVGFFLLSGIMVKIFGEHETDFSRLLKASRTAVYIIAFLATFTAPIVEEVVYRGIVYSAFLKKFGIWTAVAASTLLFAGVHYAQYWGDITAITLVTLLSLILTMVRARTGNLLPCVILHTVFNGLQALALLLEPFISKYAEGGDKPVSIIFHFLK